jgi:lysozyme
VIQYLFSSAQAHANRILFLALFVLLFSLVLFAFNALKNKPSRGRLITINLLASMLFTTSVVAILILINHRTMRKPKIKGVDKRIENIRHHEEGDFVFGIDVSHYNGYIDWPMVKTSKHQIQFVVVRATMGKNGLDKSYHYNIAQAEQQGFLVGTYHYYRPNENSTKQFNQFKRHAKILKGHIRPVLDIEVASKLGTANLVQGLKNWLQLAEQTYGVKPIIYSGRVFYNQYLKGHFNDYPLWVASYSPVYKLQGMDWKIHQFSERMVVSGIPTYVDGNDFRGSLEQLKTELVIK